MYLLSKRLFDLAVASALGVLLAPLFAVIALVLWSWGGGEVLYFSVRVGRGGRLFNMVKFRTMRPSLSGGGELVTPDDDPRITPVGAFLRRHKLDELPQLLNVLRGDMSLVGPRPQVPNLAAHYRGEAAELLEVTPGITDLASLRFLDEAALLRGAEDADSLYLAAIHPEKVRLGLQYVRNRSWWMDLSILARTAVAIVGSFSGERFLGNLASTTGQPSRVS